jgi:hypothetical protein
VATAAAVIHRLTVHERRVGIQQDRNQCGLTTFELEITAWSIGGGENPAGLLLPLLELNLCQRVEVRSY